MKLKHQLLTLAPLLDRLGRTLTDAAPHMASYASSLPDENSNVKNNERNISSTRSIDVEQTEQQQDRPSLFSLFPIPGRRTDSTSQLHLDQSQLEPTGEDGIMQPDYVDFVNGFVNTTRGEVRNRGNRNTPEDGSGLLSAYLAAASLSSLAGNDEDTTETSENGMQGLGRLLRQRDNNNGTGGGIDIHIHAIVTGPGVGNGGMGLAVLGEPQVASARPILPSPTSRRSNIADSGTSPSVQPADEDELGIFSDLYSENPPPVDLQNGITPVDGNRNNRINQTQIVQNESVDTNATNSERNIISETPPTNRQHSMPPPRRSSSSRRGGNFSRLLRRALSRRNRGANRTNSSSSLRNN